MTEINKYNILVIDDELYIRELYSELLTYHGYKVTTAGDGVAALSIMRTTGFDLIICDIAMPGMRGFDVCLEAGKIIPGVKIIMVSAYDSADNVEKAKKAGAQVLISKPFKAEDLLRAIKNALKDKNQDNNGLQ